jgi:hypothetical protein
MGDLNSMLCDKVLFFLRATENALDDSYMSLALMQPLLEDKRITNPLDQTYAANALNALTWTLFSRAAIDALKATVDGMDGSARLDCSVSALPLTRCPECLVAMPMTSGNTFERVWK